MSGKLRFIHGPLKFHGLGFNYRVCIWFGISCLFVFRGVISHRSSVRCVL